MEHSPFFRIQQQALQLWQQEGILDENVTVVARILTTEEAIGTPDRNDYPLQRGKEKLMEATFRGERGQAYTDHFGNFSATLREICALPADSNLNRAIFIATLNAVQRSLGKVANTIHCRDKGPTICAPKFADHIRATYGKALRITQIGYQPSIAEALSAQFELRLIDLDPDNIGMQKEHFTVEGEEHTAEAMDWAELLVVTGSTVVNDSIGQFIREDKPTIFYGTSVAAAAELMGWQRFCCESM